MQGENLRCGRSVVFDRLCAPVVWHSNGRPETLSGMIADVSILNKRWWCCCSTNCATPAVLGTWEASAAPTHLGVCWIRSQHCGKLTCSKTPMPVLSLSPGAMLTYVSCAVPCCVVCRTIVSVVRESLTAGRFAQNPCLECDDTCADAAFVV